MYQKKAFVMTGINCAPKTVHWGQRVPAEAKPTNVCVCVCVYTRIYIYIYIYIYIILFYLKNYAAKLML